MFQKKAMKFAALGLGSVLVLAGCSGGGDDDGGTEAGGDDAASTNEPVTLRAAHAQDPSHPYQICGLEFMSDYLDENHPDANITLESYPSAQLGSNEENMEELQAGTLDFAIPGIGSLTIFDDRVGAVETAFSVENQAQLQELVDGDFGAEVIEPLRESANVRILGPLWALGDRHITANFPVHSPADLEGVAMRSQQQAASRATTEALGGTPTPVDFSELYLSLSQGLVEAQENPLVQIDSANLVEVQDYIMMTHHIVNVSILAMAESSYQNLSDSQKEAIEDAAAATAANVDQCIADGEEEIMAQWEADDAITVIPQEELDMDAFRANALEVYTGEGSEYAELWGDLYLELTGNN